MAVSDTIRNYFLKEHGVSLEQASELVGSSDPSALAKAGIMRDRGYDLPNCSIDNGRPIDRRSLEF